MEDPGDSRMEILPTKAIQIADAIGDLLSIGRLSRLHHSVLSMFPY